MIFRRVLREMDNLDTEYYSCWFLPSVPSTCRFGVEGAGFAQKATGLSLYLIQGETNQVAH